MLHRSRSLVVAAAAAAPAWAAIGVAFAVAGVAVAIAVTVAAAGVATSPAVAATARAAADSVPARYRDGRELVAELKRLAHENPRVELREIGSSAGGQKLRLIEIAPHPAAAEDDGVRGPAALVVGDPLGTSPLAIEAAVRLARHAAVADAATPAARVRWYVLPAANPDAADRHHRRPLHLDGRNRQPVDSDADGLVDEDGPDDLDGDDAITTLLREEPGGAWLLAGDPPLPRRADAAAGETGRYARELEGIDDDGDGRWNEDPRGGVVMGRNFPPGYDHDCEVGGPWPGFAPETRALLEFAHEHPEIAIVMVLGESTNLPADPDRGCALGLHRDDIAWWRAIAAERGRLLARAGLAGPRLDSPGPLPGSVEDWAYQRLGVPAVAVDLWSLPLPLPASVDTGTSAAERVALQAFARAHPQLDVVRPWTEVTLPGGARGLAGGAVPYVLRTPPAAWADSLLEPQLPFLLDLPGWLPRLEIPELTAERRAGGAYAITARLVNGGRLPYPTAQGARMRRPAPVAVTLEGAEVIEGHSRQLVRELPAGGAELVVWVVHGRPDDRVTVRAEAPGLGRRESTVVLPREKPRR
ncbi:MAG: M14 family zinc carboxypeptidase [Candidatus Krumholzibacteriia bacterium]